MQIHAYPDIRKAINIKSITQTSNNLNTCLYRHQKGYPSGTFIQTSNGPPTSNQPFELYTFHLPRRKKLYSSNINSCRHHHRSISVSQARTTSEICNQRSSNSRSSLSPLGIHLESHTMQGNQAPAQKKIYS